MFVVVWQFEIAEEKIAAFEAAYGPDGSLGSAFSLSPEYKGTELLRDAYESRHLPDHRPLGQRRCFSRFRKEHDTDYETLDRSCDALTTPRNPHRRLLGVIAARCFPELV